MASLSFFWSSLVPFSILGVNLSIFFIAPYSPYNCALLSRRKEWNAGILYQLSVYKICLMLKFGFIILSYFCHFPYVEIYFFYSFFYSHDMTNMTNNLSPSSLKSSLKKTRQFIKYKILKGDGNAVNFFFH